MPATAHPQPLAPQQGDSVNVVHWCVEQSSHAPPIAPQTAIVLPGRHLPSASQQPMQIFAHREEVPPSSPPASLESPESIAALASRGAIESVTALPSSPLATTSTVGLVASISGDEASSAVLAS
jgi:hypothetical protein